MVAHLTVDCINIKSSQPLPTVSHNGVLYVVCNVGDEFHVRASVHNPSDSDYKVSLKVDGIEVGYSKIVWMSHAHFQEVTFRGFLSKQGLGSQPTTYRAFKTGACKPAQDAALVEHPDEIKAGRIDVALSAVVAAGKLDATVADPAHITNDAVKKKLPEGKKWFLAPGLKAEAGTVQSTNEQWNTTRYLEVQKLQPMQLRYDSHEALLLRKVLNPNIAAHRAILLTCKDPRIAAMGNLRQDSNSQSRQQPAARQQAGASSSRDNQTGAAVKGEGIAGVKRELGADEEPMPRSATAEAVDLTGEKRAGGPLLVDGRALGPDELAVCDLCDSDGEAAPTWQVKKKRTMTIE